MKTPIATLLIWAIHIANAVPVSKTQDPGASTTRAPHCSKLGKWYCDTFTNSIYQCAYTISSNGDGTLDWRFIAACPSKTFCNQIFASEGGSQIVCQATKPDVPAADPALKDPFSVAAIYPVGTNVTVYGAGVSNAVVWKNTFEGSNDTAEIVAVQITLGTGHGNQVFPVSDINPEPIFYPLQTCITWIPSVSLNTSAEYCFQFTGYDQHNRVRAINYQTWFHIASPSLGVAQTKCPEFKDDDYNNKTVAVVEEKDSCAQEGVWSCDGSNLYHCGVSGTVLKWLWHSTCPQNLYCSDGLGVGGLVGCRAATGA
ncbi:hypothetical protein HDU78_006137 [Chytriomyces hyalinus]|nr:hypothetical protein HDU78_006137 [Chytriomyces hyalinus]